MTVIAFGIPFLVLFMILVMGIPFLYYLKRDRASDVAKDRPEEIQAHAWHGQ